jgi:hypothetical protein
MPATVPILVITIGHESDAVGELNGEVVVEAGLCQGPTAWVDGVGSWSTHSATAKA